MTETPTFGEMIGIIRRKRGMRYADVSGSTHGVAGLRPIHRTEVMRIERDRRMNPKLTTLRGANHFTPLFHDFVGGKWVSVPKDPAGEQTVRAILDAIKAHS